MQLPVCSQELPAHVASDPQLKAAQQQLAARHYDEAKRAFAAYLATHPESVDAQMGVADCDLAQHHYEAAELEYRRIVATHPQLWLAHKNLVVVEAGLGRWEAFNQERAILRDARAQGAVGIGARESDVIDGFDEGGEHWIVREYPQPVGVERARYNFERFSAEGRAQEYISLESAAGADALLAQTLQGAREDVPLTTPVRDYALDWYTGSAHGRIRAYVGAEPSYEQVRADAVRWIRRQPHISRVR